MLIGVLALQGAFREHVQMLETLGVACREVRLPADMQGIDGLVIPGRESTVISRLAHATGLHSLLKEWIQADKPTLGTCAGLILLADRLERGIETTEVQPMIYGGLPITVHRNHYGRQIASHVRPVQLPDHGELEGIFIRAPKITNVHGEKVEVLAKSGEEIVGVRHGHLLGLSFHPELTRSDHFHRLFLSLISDSNHQN